MNVPDTLETKRGRSASSRAERLLLLCGLTGLLAILALARFLHADPRGYGTHEQLGFPPCVTQRFLHLPCPFCGMTTSFSLMAHGRVYDAFLTQPAGALAFVAVLAACFFLGVLLLSGRPIPVDRLNAAAPRWGRYLLVSLFLAWVYKIAASFIHPA